MRAVLTIVGVIAFLVGALWIGQGTGYVHWPASSFMINEMKWCYYGIALAVVGLLLILYARRRA